MLKLTHRLAPFAALTPSAPTHYGFNTFQVAIDPWTPGDEDQVVSYVEAAPAPMNVLLAITPKPGSVYFSGTLTNAFEDAYHEELEHLLYRLGARVVGIRVNHEYRPSLFSQAPGWVRWLQQKDYAMWQYVVVGQKVAWQQLLLDTTNWMNPVQFLEQTTGTLYDAPRWADFRKTFRHWIQYRCEWSATVINRLADITTTLTGGLPFYVYPGGCVDTFSPRVMPREEYTLDQGLLNSRIIMEAGTWNGRTPVWCNTLTATIDGPYIWTTQVGAGGIATANAQEEFFKGMGTRNMNGGGPSGYGLWTDWVPDPARPESVAEAQKFFDDLAWVLSWA